MPRARVDDIELFYTDGGSGQNVLLLHGWACDGTDWSYQSPVLLDQYRSINLDLRGHGRSGVPESGYRVRDFAADVAKLLRQLDAAPATIVGHSLGGAVAVALGVEYPELVRSVVSIEGAYGFPPEIAVPVVKMVEEMQGPQGLDVARQFFLSSFYTTLSPAHLRAWHSRRLMGTPQHVVWQTCQGIFAPPDQFALRPQAEEYLGRLRAPLLALRTGEGAHGLAGWEESQAGNRASRAVSWPEHGHWPHQERASAFNGLLVEWLDGLQ
ncbi:MAG: alpha/beta hydrolase [Dehalococcoidia bacterium]|nr:alpha/beta hydrolase [Dehalococcoidia bacterium]